MTVTVERTFEVDASPEAVWDLLSDPARRAEAISVVEDFEITGDRTATWHVRLPLPLLRRTVAVETEELERDPPRFVSFVGRSPAMTVEGEHRIDRTDEGSRIVNRFVVDGRIPGIEQFFTRNLDRELANLEAAFQDSPSP